MSDELLTPQIRRELVEGLTVRFSASQRPQLMRVGWSAPIEVPTVRISFKDYYDGMTVRLSWADDQAIEYKVSMRSAKGVKLGQIYGNLDLDEEFQDIYDPLALEVALVAIETHALFMAESQRAATAVDRGKRIVAPSPTEAIYLIRALRKPWEEAWGSVP